MRITFMMDNLLSNAFAAIIGLLIPILFYPITSITTLFVCVWMFVIDKCITKCIRDSRKLHSYTNSFVVHELISTVAGVETIRAYKKEDMFLTRYR